MESSNLLFKPGTYVAFYMFTVSDDELTIPLPDYILMHEGYVKEYDWHTDTYVVDARNGQQYHVPAPYLVGVPEKDQIGISDVMRGTIADQVSPFFDYYGFFYWVLCAFITIAVIVLIYKAATNG